MKKILILVCLTVLVPSALPLGNYPVAAKNSSWVQIQGPTISGGIISHLLVDPIDPDHLLAFQKYQDGKYILFESQDGAVSLVPVQDCQVLESFVYLIQDGSQRACVNLALTYPVLTR